MTPEIQAKWVAALRSGEYTQTRGVLKDTDGGMCCLGVLCDIYHKETGLAGWDETRTKKECIKSHDGKETVTGVHFESAGFGSSASKFTFPGENVIDWTGGNTCLRNGIDFHDLACANDSGKTFAQIADMIELPEYPGDSY